MIEVGDMVIHLEGFELAIFPTPGTNHYGFGVVVREGKFPHADDAAYYDVQWFGHWRGPRTLRHPAREICKAKQETMKPGDSVIVRQLSTGDPQWQVKLYQQGTPVLLVEHHDAAYLEKSWVSVIHQGKKMHLRSTQVEIARPRFLEEAC